MSEKTWTQEELITHLKTEQLLDSRFPVRVIFVNSLSNYIKLVEAMMDINVNTISLSKYCSDPDVLPDIKALIKDVLATDNKINLILSMGEYLRLSLKLQRKWNSIKELFNLQQQPISPKRLWLPLYCSSHIFEELIGKMDIRHESDVFYLEPIETDESFNLNIYPKEFKNIIMGDNVADGIQSWINIWDEKVEGTNYNLITKHIEMIEESDGVYSVGIIRDAYELIRNNIANADQLDREWGENSLWVQLLKYTSNTHSVDQLLLKALNLGQYDHYYLLSSWSFIGDFEKWVMWVWNRIHGSNDYVSYAINRASTYSEIVNTIECGLFDMPELNENEWLKQRSRALGCLHVEKLSDDFWKSFVSISDAKKKIKLLSDNTEQERVQLIKAISQLLKNGNNPEDIIELMEGKYPELCEYLVPSYKYESKELDGYLEAYRIHKLKDEFDFIIEAACEEINCYIWSFASRGSILEKYADYPDAFLLCIDGMGIEWLGLFLAKVKKLASIKPQKIVVTTAKVPTDTDTNWPMVIPGIKADKINQLDDISHDKNDSNTAEYSLILARQLAVFDDFAERINKLYESHKTLIITADHGLSRMAALAFHKIKGIALPPGAEARNLGRYCVLTDENQTVSLPNTERDGSILAFRNHQHFTSPGRANGELHGGASPEELLVPVIIFENPNFKGLIQPSITEPITFDIKTEKVKRSASRTVELEIIFNRAISSMQAAIEKKTGLVKQINDKSWSVSFEEVEFQEYELQIIADGILLKDNKTFTVERKGLQVNDDF